MLLHYCSLLLLLRLKSSSSSSSSSSRKRSICCCSQFRHILLLLLLLQRDCVAIAAGRRSDPISSQGRIGRCWCCWTRQRTSSSSRHRRRPCNSNDIQIAMLMLIVDRRYRVEAGIDAVVVGRIEHGRFLEARDDRVQQIDSFGWRAGTRLVRLLRRRSL